MYSGASMITEYNDDEKLSPNKSKEDLYTNRLQTRIKELKKSIKNNKPVIDQLKAQRKFFKKICEKQREKIEGVSIDLIKQEYEKEIQNLQEDRFRMQDMITVIHEESNKKVQEYVDAKSQLKQNQMFLRKSLEEIELENIEYEKIISMKNQNIDELCEELEDYNREIKNKQNVERKYREAMKNIQELQELYGPIL